MILEHDLELCAKYKVPVIITSLGARADVNDAVHGWGGIVLHDVINNRFARKAIEKGADGLIAVAAGSIVNAGMDPDKLPESDPSAMNFGGGRKAWKEIWGSGQGIGIVKEVVPARALVERLRAGYVEARQRLS